MTATQHADFLDILDEVAAMAQIDYSNLSRMTQPQMKAMAYLIRQKGGQ